MTFERRLDKLFDEALSVVDTVWYSHTETLRDAIVRIYYEVGDDDEYTV